MKTGKVSENIIKRSVLKNISKVSAEDYPDCALFTGYVSYEGTGESGAHALIKAANRAAQEGYRPIRAALSVTMPQRMKEKRLKEIIASADREAVQRNIAIISGHSESIPELKYPIVTVVLWAVCTYENRTYKQNDGCVTNKRGLKMAVPGQTVIMTKWAGIYGSALLATEHAKGPDTKYPPFLTEEARELWQFVSVEKEAAIAYEECASCMYACSDGGVYAGLWKLADRSGVGIEAELKAIPIRQETVELCEYYDINPYRMNSDGSLLIATDKPDELIGRLIDEEIPACVIGRVTEGIDRVIISGEEKRFLEEPTQDELCKVLW